MGSASLLTTAQLHQPLCWSASLLISSLFFSAGAISLTSMQPDTKAQRKEEKRKKKKEQKTLVVDSESGCFWMDRMHDYKPSTAKSKKRKRAKEEGDEKGGSVALAFLFNY